MGARNLSHHQYSIERDVVKLYARATGAATSALTGQKGKGVVETAIARTGVGAHTITLKDLWAGLLMFKANIIDAGTVDDWEVTIVEDLVSTAASKTLKIQVFKGGTAADLPTTAIILMEITVSNTKQAPTGY